ncbi:MAG: galactose mutarotase [Dysgonamonadaceae bacterium]|jgi:aldose 1-epimerase|nr:galactose mutarotase [Dysgonamonadaceae bacterium]
MKKLLYTTFFAVIFLLSCNQSPQKNLPLIDAANFDTIVDNQPVALYTLNSGQGLVMQITNYGGRIVSLWAPDRNGNYEDVVLGFDSMDKYINNQDERFLGPAVGRYANRIAKAQFTLDGVIYQLPANDNGNCLHGGLKGFDSRVWQVDSVSGNSIQLSFVSPDWDEGFPGTVHVQMTYTLTPGNELKIDYSATTDKPTHINLTNHSQFNLKGAGNGNILDHILTVNSEAITPVDSLLIPTGELMPTTGTPFDFTVPTVIGERIDSDNPQLKVGSGYDHNWVINRKTANEAEWAATLYEPESGRVLEVYTDQPGIQIYTGNFFNGKVKGKYGKPMIYRCAVALETQKYPDTPNRPEFPSTRLNPGETYTQTCIYKFSIK